MTFNYARDLTNFVSRITMNIKRSTHLQDHIQGGSKKTGTLYTLFCTS